MVFAAALILIAAAVTTVIAVTHPAGSSGRYDRDIIDRVRFTVQDTDFTLAKTTDGPETFELSFRLTAQKTEADFYAVLHSVEIEGLTYDSMIFQTASGDVYLPEEMPLPAEGGRPVPVEWTVRLVFTAQTADSADFDLVLSYTSGVTQETADGHVLKVPMHITFE